MTGRSGGRGNDPYRGRGGRGSSQSPSYDEHDRSNSQCRGRGRGRGRGSSQTLPYRDAGFGGRPNPPFTREQSSDGGGYGGEGFRGSLDSSGYQGYRDTGSRSRSRTSSRASSHGGSRGGRSGTAAPGEIYRDPAGTADPSVKVQKLEDSIIKSQLHQEQTPTFPHRPAYGTAGRKIVLHANYLNLDIKLEKDLHWYGVKVSKPGEDKALPVRKVKRVIQLLLEQHFPNPKSIVTDYRSNLISLTDLNITDPEVHVMWKAEGEETYPEDRIVYHATIEEKGTIKVSDFLDYVKSTDTNLTLDNKELIVQALNTIISHGPKSDPSIGTSGSNKHFLLAPAPQDHVSLSGGLEAIRGYMVSVRPGTDRVLLNVQVKNLACYEPANLKTLILSRSAHSMRDLEKFIKGLQIELTCTANNNVGKSTTQRAFIWGLARETKGSDFQGKPPIVEEFGAGPRRVRFWLAVPSGNTGPSQGSKQKGKEPVPEVPRYVTVEEFFKKKYGINADPNVPVVNIGTPASPVYVPAEACKVVPGQMARFKLSPQQTQAMIDFTVRTPAANATSIARDGTQLLGFRNPDASQSPLSMFQLKPGTRLLTVPGRVLDTPTVIYGDASFKAQGGRWNMKNYQFNKTRSLGSWAYVMIDFNEDLTEPIRQFISNLNNMGITADLPIQRFTAQASSIEATFKKIAPQNYNFVLVILGNQNPRTYNMIKQVCDIRYGICHSCVLVGKFKRMNPTYISNVTLKINLKLGGTNQCVKDLGIIDEGKTMLVGIDVTHPSPGSAKNAPSIAAIVASVDQDLGPYPAAIHVQTSKQEKVDALTPLLLSRLDLWMKHNKGTLPENIIVYRDGVSEGQYNMVINEELPQLKAACTKKYPVTDQKKGLPRITIVIVGKRHNTRFYVTTEAEADFKANNNPKYGTVVDRGVTEARNWDFFLQAHTAPLGTARPAHYCIVYDEVFQHLNKSDPCMNKADVLQDLTNKLSYTNVRCTLAASICPPARYADLVCERARCYMASVFDPSTSSTGKDKSVATEDEPFVVSDAEIHQDRVTIHERIKDTMFYI